MQGTADKVVPLSQADTIVNAINKNGGKAERILFEGEGHGWVKAETIKRAVEAEREFYEDVFGVHKSAT